MRVIENLQSDEKTEEASDDVKGPEARCLMSLEINKPDCKTELPVELDATETTLEASHIPPLAVDEPKKVFYTSCC